MSRIGIHSLAEAAVQRRSFARRRFCVAAHSSFLSLAGIFGLLLASTRPAYADMPIVFIFLIAPVIAWWATIVGLIFEGFCVWRFLGLNWYRSAAGVLVANIASTLVGAVPIWFLGGALELYLRRALSGYDPLTQVALGFAVAQILLPAINTAIELPILVLFGVRWQWHSAMIVYAANFASVALLIWPLLVR